jgi:uncharacterized protein (TIGR04255 family)
MASYKHAPIQEAVIDLRVKTPATQDGIQKSLKRLANRYPDAEELRDVEVAFDNTGGNVNVVHRQSGFKISSADKADIALVKTTGLTSARLAPYEGWEKLYELAQSNWEAWCKGTRRTQAERIGVRYINRLDIPFAGREGIPLEHYLKFVPNTPDFSHRPLLSHSVRVVKQLEDKRWTCTIISTMVDPPPLIGHLSLLLDIDVFRQEDIPSHDDALWEEIAAVRELKNNVFEACITDQARELFL